MNFSNSNHLRKKSHSLIPGGAHTYSKGDDQFPELSPGFIVRGKGAYVWDVDGNKFLDWGMGLRSTTLGYGYKPVLNAVRKQLIQGANFARPSPLEVEFAELLTDIIPCAEMVKFAKNGSTVTTAAVKLARAYTGRDMVAICSCGSFFSYDDWFIGSTPVSRGIPQAIRELTVSFKFNDIKSLEGLFVKYPGKIACIIMEPATEIAPADDFLKKAQFLCKENGAVFILDEMISGFRWHLKGAQHVYGVTPDMATYGKGIANGFSVAVLAGKREIMDLGSIKGPDERVFLISTTHGAENHSLAAAIAAIKEMKKYNVPEHLISIGAKLRDSLNDVSRKFGLENILNVFGDVPCRLAMSAQPFGSYDSFQIKTYFFQEMIARGILFNGYFSPSFSHRDREVKNTVKAWSYACNRLEKALDKNELERLLIGKTVKPVFRKYNNKY
jgi:glutamate-1-semialdehyde 2,1-aminomutase